MATQPLTPTGAIAPATTASTPPASVLEPASKTAIAPVANLTPPPPASVNFNKAKVASQSKSERSGATYTPVSLQIQEGNFKGRFLDLGIEVGEVSHDQSAEWEAEKGDGIRAGANFKRLSPRTISFSCSFFVLNDDVAALAANLAILHQIAEDTGTPPKCLLIQGTLRATSVYCRSIKEKYSAPLPKDKGYRRVVVDLAFELAGGKNSPDKMGIPLAPNSQTDWKNSTTATDRDRAGSLQVAKSLLSPTLSPKANAQLSGLIKDEKLRSPADVAKLDSNAFVQGVAGGIFDPSLLKTQAISDKLRIDLAAVLAANEDGAGIESRKLADAILKGNPSGLSPKLQQEFDKIKGDYDTILDAMQKQQLDAKSKHPIFDKTKNPTALGRLTELAGSGLALRNVGGATLGQPQGTEKETLDAINKFLASNTDEKIRAKFKLTSDAQLKILKNSAPYASKNQFLQDAARGNVGIKGYDLWSTFTKSEPTLPIATPPAPVEGPEGLDSP